MLLEDLPTELLAQVFVACPAIPDVLHLAHTCHRLHDVFKSRKLQILSEAAEAEYGPLQDAIQLVTHNASQPAHIQRAVPLSDALLKQVLQVGRVAKRLEETYPVKKWKDNYRYRRLLHASESYTFRRAVYRYSLYAAAFHNPTHKGWMRLQPPVIRERAELLHNWSNTELAEIEDLRRILRDTLRFDICPSNGTIQRQFHRRFPGNTHQLMFNVHLNYPPPTAPTGFSSYATAVASPRYPQSNSHTHSYSSLFHHHLYNPIAPTPQSVYYDKTTAKLRPTRFHEPGAEGWGDDISHYYLIEDMMKLSPAQILHLREHAARKSQVLEYMREWGGEWFENNGETFGQTLEFVLTERGEDVDCFMVSVDEGFLGIACGGRNAAGHGADSDSDDDGDD